MLLFKREEENEKAITSPDDLRSVTVVVKERDIKKAVLYRNYDLSPNALLRFFTVLDLIKHKQRAADYPVKISPQVAVLQKPEAEVLYIFRDANNLSEKVTQDVFFIRDKVAKGKPLFEANRDYFEETIKNLKSVREQRKANQLLSNDDFVDTYEDFWNNVIIFYPRIQNDIVRNFLFNVFKKYALY